MKFQTAYSKKADPQTKDFPPTLAKQALEDEANINKIVNKHTNRQVLADLDKLEKVYGQVTSGSLMEAYQMIDAASAAFYEVPSEIRKRFGQDAGKFIDFATDPANIDQMRKWGLAPQEVPEPSPDPAPAPDPVPGPTQ